MLTLQARWQAYKSSRRLAKVRKNAVLEDKLGYWCEGTYYSLHTSCKHKDELDDFKSMLVENSKEHRKMMDKMRDETNRVENQHTQQFEEMTIDEFVAQLPVAETEHEKKMQELVLNKFFNRTPNPNELDKEED